MRILHGGCIICFVKFSFFFCSKIDKPTPPRNVKVNDIRKDRCHLHWEPPLDDGGSGITRYVVEAIDLSMPESNWNIAGETFDPQKCDFPCTNLDEGHRYKFRVFAVNQLGKSQPCTLAGDGILMRDPWGKSLFFKQYQSIGILDSFQILLILHQGLLQRIGVRPSVTCLGTLLILMGAHQ